MYSGLLFFFTSSVVWYSKNTKYNVSETDLFQTSGEGWEISTRLGPVLSVMTHLSQDPLKYTNLLFLRGQHGGNFSFE